MSTSGLDYRKYLDPAVLAKISGLELRARLILDGFLSGTHRSGHRGLAVEFASHRAYTQSDDIRHIDWKVFGRTDKHYVKEYEQETNLDVMLVVDCSESMGYKSHLAAMSKHEYATSIVAAISYLALQQQDSVGLALFDEHLQMFMRPSGSSQHWKALVHELESKVGQAKTASDRVFSELVERMRHRMLVVIVGDMFDDPRAVLRGLRQLRYRRHELVVLNVWDPAELALPFSGPIRFEGLEQMGTISAEPDGIRARYLEEVARFQAELRRGCSELHVDYVVFNTAAPLDAALSTYLAARTARMRFRSSRVAGSA